MSKKVIVIGGGIAGMEAAAYLSAMDHEVTLIEKNQQLGGHLLNWERLFPTKRMGSEVLDFLHKGLDEKIKIITGATVKGIEKTEEAFIVKLQDGTNHYADALMVTTGYDLFDARRKEEYGYGIYDNVITSAELEKMFSEGKPVLTKEGQVPKRVGFIHCVGSRDEKVNIHYCSKVCCVTAVKQAIEIKERIPEAETFCFYMDMRMFGMHFEHLYKEAQSKYHVNFIRGRLSEANETIDHKLLIKVEDTLAGKPLKMTVDLLVLMVGFLPSQGTKDIGAMLGLQFGINGFYKTADMHTLTNVSNVKGVFFAGTCTSPKTITQTITDARAAAAKVHSYLKGAALNERYFDKWYKIVEEEHE